MPLLALGLNHRTAPLALREQVSFPPERLPGALHDLAGREGVAEAAILSTCNRTDLYLNLGAGDGAPAVEWLRDYHRLGTRDLERCLYSHRADGAVRHVLRVASGLDSMVLGEPQILGQLKDAYDTARESGTVGTILGRLFQHSFQVAKRVRSDTAIGASPVSVAYAAVSLARQIFGDLARHTALLVGAGETVELAARHLARHGLGRMIVANRTWHNAHRLASEFGGFAITLDEIGAHLAEADIVLTSTAGSEPIVRRTAVEHAVRARRRRPMFIVDIAVPRDVESEVRDLRDVYLYSIDDLQEVIRSSLRSREDAAREAEVIVDAQVDCFMRWLGTRAVTDTIRAYRALAGARRDEVLARARRQLAAGTPPEDVLEYLARTLTNKLTHTPTVQIREAGADRREEIIEAARTLFDIDKRK